MLQGIDVSHWQGPIDWAKVGTSVSFVSIKATEGKRGVDSLFEENWKGVAEDGRVRGAYHYFQPLIDPVAQARHFCDVVGSLGPMDLPPELDLENPPAWEGVKLADRVPRVKAWIDEVRARLGRDPMIYTSAYFWKTVFASAPDFNALPLWVAHYTTKPAPAYPPGWDWSFWQYSEKGTVPGINGPVDLNRFRSDDLNALFRLAGSGR